MKAAVYTRYGPPEVVQIADVEKPAPNAGEVLVKVHAASINPLDWKLMAGTPYVARLFFGIRKPKRTRPGVDVAGRVEAVGPSVTRFKPGDEVFGACRGAFAEYVCTPETVLAAKPANVTFEQASCAAVAGFTALQGLRDKGRIQAGQKVLVNGAAGGVGTFAVQVAKSFGADVTGVCSARNVEMVRSLGADRVIDYTQEDFAKDEGRYHLFFDCIGNRSVSECRRVLKPGGLCVMVGGPKEPWPLMGRLARALVSSLFVKPKFVMFVARRREEDLALLRDLMAAGKLTPVVDRCYNLSQVREALRYQAEGHARGKVIVTP
jgi:NADPH:quinone reductase-like Zn-dependent oxidoreductase